MKKTPLIGIAVAAAVGVLGATSISVPEPEPPVIDIVEKEPEPPEIQRTVVKEPEPPVIKQVEKEPEPPKIESVVEPEPTPPVVEKVIEKEIEESKILLQDSIPGPSENYPTQTCQGNAGCIKGHVTKVIDGDTIEVDGSSVRLVLVDTPEYGEYGYNDARNHIKSICPVGSPVLIDVDDWQERDRYGRILGVVYCDEWNLNRAILASGLAVVYERYCSDSEFGQSSWITRYGCSTSKQTTETKSIENCDPSYPDFCIPSPPPDLDCKDIPQKRFKVLQPDPHRFDGDKDGIGCE